MAELSTAGNPVKPGVLQLYNFENGVVLLHCFKHRGGEQGDEKGKEGASGGRAGKRQIWRSGSGGGRMVGLVADGEVRKGSK